MALSTVINLSVSANQTSALDLGTVALPVAYSHKETLTNGTGANQANELFSDTRTLAASASENLDLAGVLTNAFGTTITFTKVKAIIVAAAPGNTNDVLVGGAATNAFINWVGDATDTVKVKPGGMFVITAPDTNGLAVTAGTGDILKVANAGAGTSVTYDVIIIGA